MSSSDDTASLPYHEPGIATILVLSSFLLLLNVVNHVLDRIVYCGLIGQLFVGIGWGMPGANWLSTELQHSILQLGYIGLILIVYEGGISSNFQALRANVFLSLAVASTGVAAPIGISFVLRSLLPLSPVQAFAAGAALCSTSLGTTFTVLATSGLTESRLGVVLVSAAMMDDVVGLIMVQIISSLGAGSDFTEVTVIRPVFVSIAFVVLTPLICLFVAKPIMRSARVHLDGMQNTKYRTILCSSRAALTYQTGVLLAMVTGATYAGTSNLFAAYLAGASVSWLGDGVASNKTKPLHSTGQTTCETSDLASSSSDPDGGHSFRPIPTTGNAVIRTASKISENVDECSGKDVYEKYYLPVVNAILRPFFFASIGFAIPITRMFAGRVIWRGFVYTILMVFAKPICGTWLIRLAPMPQIKSVSKPLPLRKLPTSRSTRSSQKACDIVNQQTAPTDSTSGAHQVSPAAVLRQSSNALYKPSADDSGRDAPDVGTLSPHARNMANTTRKRTALPKPKSLYPGAILGSAMVSRGEIGFLISSVAETNGIFGEGGNTEEYLVVTWAILLCTLIGPIAVGLLVKRVRRLQQVERSRADGQEDPLGIWGVVSSNIPS